MQDNSYRGHSLLHGAGSELLRKDRANNASPEYRIGEQGKPSAPIRPANAGSCPSRQRDCVATAARSAETKGTSQLVLRTQAGRKESAPIRPANAAAQLVLRTQAGRKEKERLYLSCQMQPKSLLLMIAL